MNMIATVTENLLLSTKLFNLVFIVNQKLRKTQACLRGCVVYKKVIYKRFVKRWNYAEGKLYSKLNQANVLKKPRYTVFGIQRQNSISEGTTLIPKEIKIMYIRNHLKEQFRGHFRLLQEYYIQRNEVQAINDKNKWKIESLRGKVEPFPEKPKIPFLKTLISLEQFFELISTGITVQAIYYVAGIIYH